MTWLLLTCPIDSTALRLERLPGSSIWRTRAPSLPRSSPSIKHAPVPPDRSSASDAQTRRSILEVRIFFLAVAMWRWLTTITGIAYYPLDSSATGGTQYYWNTPVRYTYPRLHLLLTLPSRSERRLLLQRRLVQRCLQRRHRHRNHPHLHPHRRSQGLLRQDQGRQVRQERRRRLLLIPVQRQARPHHLGDRVDPVRGGPLRL